MVGSCSETGNAPDYVSVGDLGVIAVSECLQLEDVW